MTSVAIFQLIEKGQIHLDDPVQKFIPSFPMKSKKSITVRHLLAHTSGMAGYGSAKEAESTIEYTDLQNAVELFMDRELQFEPGADFGYNDIRLYSLRQNTGSSIGNDIRTIFTGKYLG